MDTFPTEIVDLVMYYFDSFEDHDKFSLTAKRYAARVAAISESIYVRRVQYVEYEAGHCCDDHRLPKMKTLVYGVKHSLRDEPAVKVTNLTPAEADFYDVKLVAVRSTWYRRGLKHRDGVAQVDCSGVRRWYKHGKLDRAGDLPALDWTTPTSDWEDPCTMYYGRTEGISLRRCREWWRNGEFCVRSDKPSREDDQGGLYWMDINGYHRDGDLPAVDTKNCKRWYKHGMEHRDGDLPAHVTYDDDGQICRQAWFYHGHCCRADGKPPVLHYGEPRCWHTVHDGWSSVVAPYPRICTCVNFFP